MSLTKPPKLNSLLGRTYNAFPLVSSLGAGHHITEVMVDVPLILRVRLVFLSPLGLSVCKITSNLGTLQLTTAFQLLYLVALTLIKCSILCFYLRIFTDHFMVKPCRVTFGIVMLWGVAHFFAVIFICRPVQAQWDLSVTGTCGNQIKLFQSIISTNIVTDLIIIILPLYSKQSSLGLLSWKKMR